MQSQQNDAALTLAQAEPGDLDQQRASIAEAQCVLRVQRAEIVRMMTELKQIQEAVRRQHDPEREVLRRENDELRRALAGAAVPPGRPAVPPEVVHEVEGLRADTELLRKLLAEKDALLKELRQQEPQGADQGPFDPDRVEAELNQFRRQLEEDRRKLTEERERLRVRNEELDDATRELEMEHSRERAELARERTRLERLRDEMKADAERIQRGAGVLNRLAPVQRLREQLVDRKDA
jgi:hypothetical protein